MKIVITGGTGTLGQALARRLLETDAERIVILSRDEIKQSVMASEFGHENKLRFFLGDVRDRVRLEDAFYGCDAVIHAAALKRVDAVAYNPSEVRKTNIEGSANVVAAAIRAGVKRVIMVSSDKACYPTNIYGVTKAAMEHEAIATNAVSYPRGIRISCVRYGNVLGSRGSVVHIWRQAVKEGKPIPLTDKQMTRFWLTIDDAVTLIMDAYYAMLGGEIFVPGMRAMRMVDLAEALAPGWPIVETGLRPGGEKLHETVVTQEESYRTRHDPATGYIIAPELHPWRVDAPWTAGEELAGALRSNTAMRLTIDDMKKMLEAL